MPILHILSLVESGVVPPHSKLKKFFYRCRRSLETIIKIASLAIFGFMISGIEFFLFFPEPRNPNPEILPLEGPVPLLLYWDVPMPVSKAGPVLRTQPGSFDVC
jgi:hypothetical protein